MNKKSFVVLYFVLILLVFVFPVSSVSSKEVSQEDGLYYTYYVKKNQKKNAEDLNIFLAGYIDALNSHNIKKLRELYSDKYKSGDGLDREETLKLVEETWQISNDLKYKTKVSNVRLFKNLASVELVDELFGSTVDESDITGDTGEVSSLSHGILYLQKYGKGWKIISDKVLFEKTLIKYGQAKNIDIDIEVPEQVMSGSNYTVALSVDVPDNMFALGSITREPLSYPRGSSEEIFRQVPGEEQTLERVVKANKNNQNEIAIASVSLCDVSRGQVTSPDISLVGTAVILRRVNVVNNSSDCK